MNSRTVASLARLAADVYRASPDVEWLKGRRVRYFEVENFEILVVWCGPHLVIAFRGSDERLDWKYNLRLYPVRDERLPGRWHRGFLAGAKRVVTHVAPYVAQHPGKVWLVGHSLGGAIAGVVAALLSTHGHVKRVAGVLQIGSPRFCSRSAARYLSQVYRDRWLRASSTGDRVPHLPPAVLGFRHVGEEIRLPARRPWWLPSWPGRFLREHKVTRYLHRLEARADSNAPAEPAGGILSSPC